MKNPLLLKSTRKTELRRREASVFLQYWWPAPGPFALLRNTRKTDSLRLIESASSPKYWSRAGAAFALLRNTRKTDSLRLIESASSPKYWSRAGAAFALLMAFSCGLVAQDKKDVEKLAPYYPTPEVIVEKMLEFGELKKGEKMFDLGSGDGRIVLMAAEKYKAVSTGVEFDKDLWFQSSERIKRLKLEKLANIIHGDIMVQDYSSANLITVYLLPISNDKVRPLLERQLKQGTRVVAHDFEIAGWVPEKTKHIEDDGEGRSHTLYLYRR